MKLSPATNKKIIGIAIAIALCLPGFVFAASNAYNVGFAIGATMPLPPPPLIPLPPIPFLNMGSGGFGGSSAAGYMGSQGGGWSLGNVSGFGLPSSSISGIIRNLLLWLLMIFGLLGIIGFVIAGIMYIVAAGDEKTIERAKEAMKYSIIGVIIGLVGIIVIQAIDLALRGTAGF